MLIETNRVGEVGYNNFGSKMTIIDYINNKNILVEFENGYQIKNKLYNFKEGNIKNPYEKRTYQHGYTGEGEYKSKINGKFTRYYQVWSNMLGRCYDDKYQEKEPTYCGCTVCDEWLNFQKFSKWYDENFYEIENEKMCLDKDILVKGNKIYSPETCIFVPQRINNLFTKRDNKRGDLPLGVSYHKQHCKLSADCCFNKNKKHLGLFYTIEEAFCAYKNFKESYIKEIAGSYKSKIPEKLYQALINYQVEITD